MAMSYPPSTTDSDAIVHICGSIEQCNYDKKNCVTSEGNRGNFKVSCIPLEES